MVGGADRGVCEHPTPRELLLCEVAMLGARCELASASEWPVPVLRWPPAKRWPKQTVLGLRSGRIMVQQE